jgi:hypothetical protein
MAPVATMTLSMSSRVIRGDAERAGGEVDGGDGLEEDLVRNLTDCARQWSMSSASRMPSENPRKLLTSLVVVS